jgi:uncharacterized protein YhaN
LLYGIKSNTSDNFLHDNKKLLIGGRLQNSAGDKLHVHRRKGNKATLLNPATEKGNAYQDDVLGPFLGGIDQDAFVRIYGIGNDQLEEGGREMAALKGLVGESLFAATVGGPGLAALMEQLDDEASNVFDSRKRTARLKTLAAKYKELSSERRTVQLARSRWERLQTDLKQARTRRDEILSREKELSRKLNRLTRIENALSLIARRKETLKGIEELAEATILPATYSAEERTRAEAELTGIREQLTQLQQSLDGDDGFEAKLNKIQIPDGLLAFEDTIHELKDQRAVTLSAAADRSQLSRDLAALQQEARDVLRDLGLEQDADDIEHLRIKPEDQVLIQNLAADSRRLREEPAKLKTQREELERTIAQLETELAETKTDGDITNLQAALVETNTADLTADQLAAARMALAKQQSSADSQLASLGLWKGSIADVPKAKIPLADSVERFRQQFDRQTQAELQLEDDRKSLQQELDEVRQSIAALETEGSVPTEAELTSLRENRDKRWQKVRDDWLRGAFTKQMPIAKAEALSTDFASAINAADHMADRLRRETERVTKLASHISRSQLLEEQLGRLNDTEKELGKQNKAGQKEWLKLWKPTSIDEPLSPAEMLGWLRRFETLKDSATKVTDLALTINELESQLNQSADSLRTALVESDYGAANLSDASLNALQNVAKKVIEAEQNRVQRFTELNANLKRSRDDLERIAAEEKCAIEALESWQLSWSECMKKIGCEKDAIAEQANERMKCLNRLFDITRRLQETGRRIDEIDAETAEFESRVADLSGRFLPGTDLKPTDAALEIDRALHAARSDQDQFERLSESLHNTSARLIELRTSEAEHSKKLEMLCQLAGVTDSTALADKERESTELSKLVERRDELEEQLHEQAGGMSLEDFVADAESVDADELPSEIGNLQDEIEGLKDQRESAAITVSDLEKLAAAADGNDEAAFLDQQALGVLSTMQDEARRYMQLRFAATLLRKQIDIHRSENEDPLLDRASQLFAVMTCEEFSGLQTDYENDRPVIVGARADGVSVPVDGMSDGTRNQLYLALRIAYVEHQLTRFEPMPFIVDDILIHFDDQRSTATLQVLNDLAKRTQVIFLTHHHHLLQLAQSHVTNEVFVHTLDSRNRLQPAPTVPA